MQVTKRPSRSSANSRRDDTDAVSFRFRRGSKDMFEELVDSNKDNNEAVNKDRKRKNEEEKSERKSSRSRSSGLHFIGL